MLILILYWLVTMISGIDFDVDFDVDIDVDVDADFDTDIEGGNIDFQDIANAEINKEDIVGKRRKPLKWWQVVLVYFNFVGLPFMFTFTCWIFIWWMLTTLVTTITHSYEITLDLLLCYWHFSSINYQLKYLQLHLRGFFKNLNKDGDVPIDIIGRRGTCLSKIKDDKMGSAEVVVENTPISIYIKSLNGEQIKFREPILIIKQSQTKIIITYNHIKLIKTKKLC